MNQETLSKNYLLSEIENAMPTAKTTPLIEYTPHKLDSISEIIEGRNNAYETNSENNGFVCFSTAQGEYKILNNKQSLAAFRKMAKRFPTKPPAPYRPKVHKTPPLTRPQGKGVKYLNPYTPHRISLLPAVRRPGVTCCYWWYHDGWFSNEQLLIKIPKPKLSCRDLSEKPYRQIIEKVSVYPVGSIVAVGCTGEGDSTPFVVIKSNRGDGIVATVPAQQVDAILTLYPKAVPLIRSAEDTFIGFKSQGKVVAVIATHTWPDDTEMGIKKIFGRAKYDEVIFAKPTNIRMRRTK